MHFINLLNENSYKKVDDVRVSFVVNQKISLTAEQIYGWSKAAFKLRKSFIYF